jgi:Fur family ferric uptake transcriptional regulator
VDPDLRDQWLARAHAELSSAGRRSGAARTAVIELLAREGQCLLSAQKILDLLRAERRTSGASVYRALEELHDLGLLRRLDASGGVARFEIVAPGRRHHHFVDDSSGSVRPFVDDGLERAIEDAAARLGVVLSGHDVVLRGRSVASMRA